MKIFVHVKERTILVQCGDGAQKIKWLGNVGIARYDSKNGQELGPPDGIMLEDGTKLDLNETISGGLPDDTHVWVVLRGDE
mmetsp:Transcript_43303/g.70269  ORF Transcript_43303/g.70269 Transcript_43303/m.70269 type:complete len:81 (+) Transcript_43303:61-303(+)